MSFYLNVSYESNHNRSQRLMGALLAPTGAHGVPISLNFSKSWMFLLTCYQLNIASSNLPTLSRFVTPLSRHVLPLLL